LVVVVLWWQWSLLFQSTVGANMGAKELPLQWHHLMVAVGEPVILFSCFGLGSDIVLVLFCHHFSVCVGGDGSHHVNQVPVLVGPTGDVQLYCHQTKLVAKFSL